jgi:hypothetical protein
MQRRAKPDRENETCRGRGIGVMLHVHSKETFEVETGTEKLTLKLEQRRRRFGSEPHNRWQFMVLGHEDLPVVDMANEEPMPQKS